MTTSEQIYQEIDLLSEDAKSFLLDFIELLKQRYPQSQLDLSKNIGAKVDNDPLIGLFSGNLNLATESKDILSGECRSESGWTWKK